MAKDANPKSPPKAKPSGSGRAKPPRRAGEPLRDPVREAFAGQRAMGANQRQAYIAAKPQAATRPNESVKVSAKRMDADPEVRERVHEIQTDLLHSSDAYLTKEKLTELLADAIRMTLTDPDTVSSGAGLVDKYCRMWGFYEPEKTEVRHGCLDEDERDRKIAFLIAAASKGEH